MLRLAAARSAASLGLDESCAARSVPADRAGGGVDVRLTVSHDGDGRRAGSSGTDSAAPATPSSRACDRSRPMPSIESGEGLKRRASLTDGRREGGLSLSASESSASDSVSRADMERESRSPRPPSAARMAGRPSTKPFDMELSRERGWLVDGRREMVTFRLADRRLGGGTGRSLDGRRDGAGDKEGRAGVGGPS